MASELSQMGKKLVCSANAHHPRQTISEKVVNTTSEISDAYINSHFQNKNSHLFKTSFVSQSSKQAGMVEYG